MFCEKIKNKRGITLIALVVTIVVLLILAGVTIAMLTGENGIINQAKNAKEESLMSELEELVDLALMEYKTDKESGKNTDLGELLKEKKEFDAVTEEEDYYIVEKNGYEVKVSKDGERLTDAEKVGGVRPQLEISKNYDEENDKVIITVRITNKSELGTIDSFKLFDSGNQEITEKTSSEDNKTFEVDKNGKYKAEVIATTDGTQKTGNKSIVVDELETIYETTTIIQDKLGNNIYIPGGFKIAKDSGENVENGIVIQDAKNGNQFVWIPVGEYKVTSEISETGKLTNNLTRREWGTTVNPSSPITPKEIDGDSVLKGNNGTYYYGEGDSRSIARDTIEEFKTNATTKGGFYIGRYEQGAGNVIKKGVTVYNNISINDSINEAKSLYNKPNDTVVSQLISSYAWDTTLNFICQIHKEGYKLATVNDSRYGNMNTGTAKKTGENINDNYSNIHDFLGNVMEWSTGYSGGGQGTGVVRGANYTSTYRVFGAYRNANLLTTTSVSTGFRTQLYVK